MHLSNVVRRVIPVGLVAVAITAAPTFAFQPSVTLPLGPMLIHPKATDLAARGDSVAVSVDATDAGEPVTDLSWSSDGGVTFDDQIVFGPDAARESQATICHDAAVMAYAARVVVGGIWRIETFHADLSDTIMGSHSWTTTGLSRKPDVACVRDTEEAVAWFQKHGSKYDVHLGAAKPGDDPSPQAFDLGTGSVSRGLAVASSSSRVYVAWFHGNDLRLRRYSIGSAPNYSLHALGTSTIATLKYGNTPRLGADGDRVILSYMDKADLKVRRSTDRGVSFGGARTLINEPFPSEVGAAPTTVAVKGSRVAIGVVEVNETSGRGLGFLSTNGGSSYVKQSTHTGGKTVAGLVNIGSTYRYAEAWDQQFSQPATELVRVRRQ